MGYIIVSAITGRRIKKCKSREKAEEQIKKLTRKAIKDMQILEVDCSAIEMFYYAERIVKQKSSD